MISGHFRHFPILKLWVGQLILSPSTVDNNVVIATGQNTGGGIIMRGTHTREREHWHSTVSVGGGCER